MTPGAFRLLQYLAGAVPLDGARYATAVGIANTAVEKQVEQLRAAGLPVIATRGGKYRLAWPVELLDADQIRHAGQLGAIGVEVHSCIDSTNDALAECFRHRHAVLAEYQTAGRGRRGRSWISPPGCGLSISFGFRFDHGLQRLTSLSLIAGVAAAETLAGEGVGVGLKWPNDLVVGQHKLGGLLVEIRGTGTGPSKVVIGLGVNARLPRAGQAQGEFRPPDQPWTDLYRLTRRQPDRNRLAGRLIAALDVACREFQRGGFAPFAPRWAALDALRGRRVHVSAGDHPVVEGLAEGVTGSGKLRVAAGGQVAELGIGEVSVRAK